MLIHINTNIIYNIVPLAVLVWSFRMSAMYFALYAANMSHIDNFSITILRQSHYWYTMISNTVNECPKLDAAGRDKFWADIKKEVVQPKHAF